VSGGSDGCKEAGGDQADRRPPWAGADRAAEKDRLFRYVRSEPEGVPLVKIVEDVFGSDGEYAQRDYQLARRFFDRHDVFQIARRDGDGGLLWVEPTLEAFHLSPLYGDGKNARRDGDGAVNSRSAGETGEGMAGGPATAGPDGETDAEGDGGDGRLAGEGDDSGGLDGDGMAGRPKWAKDRTKSYLDGHVRTEAASVKAGLLRQLAIERGATDDKFQIFERVRGHGDDYLLVPWTTRYNDPSTAADLDDRFCATLSKAARRHDSAVLVTLTTDPKRFDGLTEATESLLESKNRLLSWLAYDPKTDAAPSRPGYRPENVTALEFTDSGLPHLHVALFGLSWVTSQAALSAYWSGQQGSIVDIRTVRQRDGRWLLHDGPAGEGDGHGPDVEGDGVAGQPVRSDGGQPGGRSVSLRRYLGTGLRGLRELASLDADALYQRAESGEISNLWKQALYWATGKQYWSASPDLKPASGDDDGLPPIRTWRFVGAARYRNIPWHVKENARLADRPPPPSEGSRSAGSTRPPAD
jgi:hypothetical protein